MSTDGRTDGRFTTPEGQKSSRTPQTRLSHTEYLQTASGRMYGIYEDVQMDIIHFLKSARVN